MPDVTNTLRVFSPAAGTAMSLETVPDPVFSRGMVGPGVAIHPEPGQEGGQEGRQEAVAPLTGTLVKLRPHAFVVMAEGRKRGILVHLGIDTVQLEGEGFTLLATEGEQIRVGTPVVSWSPGGVAAAGKPSVVPVVALDAGPEELIDVVSGAVDHGDALFSWR